MPAEFAREPRRTDLEPRREEEPPSPPAAAGRMLALQRGAGNQAVARMLETQGLQGPTLRERMAQLGGRGMADPKIEAAREEQELANAFSGSVFYYGTTGGESVLKSFLDTLTQRKKTGKAPIEYYYPGERAKAFLGGRDAMGSGEEGAAGRDAPEGLMMDMYYGQAGTSLHEMRNPAIGKYVHKGMKYEGAYDQHTSGRDAYMGSYSGGEQAGVEGWQW